ncbi:MAG: hypothetical protein Q4B90_06930 [Eubacteriales bacterium]|nr:hypothetical protein [Eubacteriales bacterium]
MDYSEKNVTFDKLITLEEPQKFIESAYPFMKLMMQYQCAMLEVQTKFEVLNQQLSLESDRNPIESISCRLKKPISIIEKLKRKNLGQKAADILEKLRVCAEGIHSLDLQMQEIGEFIALHRREESKE